jgi:hypothetical protein
MKKLLLLFVVLLACSALASADSIPLWRGAGTMIESPKYHTAIYHFIFAGNYRYILSAWNTDSLEIRPGLAQCHGIECDPTKIRTLIFNTDNGPAEGMIRFDAYPLSPLCFPTGISKSSISHPPTSTFTSGITSSIGPPTSRGLLPPSSRGTNGAAGISRKQSSGKICTLYPSPQVCSCWGLECSWSGANCERNARTRFEG